MIMNNHNDPATLTELRADRQAFAATMEIERLKIENADLREKLHIARNERDVYVAEAELQRDQEHMRAYGLEIALSEARRWSSIWKAAAKRKHRKYRKVRE